MDGAHGTAFRYSYSVSPEDWGLVDKQVEVSILWSDPAGNQMDETLAAPLRFDFVPPAALSFALLPEFGNQNSKFTCSLTATELLAETPELRVTANTPGLFEDDPVASEDGYLFVWEQPAADLPSQSITVEARLVDLAGNVSSNGEDPDGFVGKETAWVDGAPPALSNPEVAMVWVESPGIEQTQLVAGHLDLVIVRFDVYEAEALANGYPEVALSVPGQAIPFQQEQALQSDEEVGSWHFEYSLAVDEVLHADAQGVWPIRVSLKDKAENLVIIDSLDQKLVQLDFTPPAAACVLIPPPPAAGCPIGATLTLQISPLEDLAPGTAPEIEETFQPPLAGPFFTWEPESTWRYTGDVEEGSGEHTFHVRVRLTDVAGNQTPPGGTACIGVGVAGGIDGDAPSVAAVSLLVDGGAVDPAAVPLKSGRTVTAFVHMTGTSQIPSLFLGDAPMSAAASEPVEVAQGTFEWEFLRQLDSSEGEGPRLVRVAGQDEAGNGCEHVAVDQPLELDFTLPTAKCTSQPDLANRTQTLMLMVQASEALDGGLPDLEATVPLLQPEPAAGPAQFTWLLPVSELAPDITQWSWSVSLTDLAGNSADSVCTGQGAIDSQPPDIAQQQVETAPPVVNAAGTTVLAAGPGDVVIAGFTTTDAQLLAKTPPAVVLDIPGAAIPFAESLKEEEGGALHWGFELALDPVLHAQAEGSWPVRVTAWDLAGNSSVEDKLGGDLVRVDFTPPEADCSLLPASGAAAGIGQKVLLQVLPFEETAGLPELDEEFDPPFGDAWFQYEPGSMYRFSRVVQEGNGERTFQTTVRLTDLVGNSTAQGENACTGDTIAGSIDGTTPVVEQVTVAATTAGYEDGDRALKQGVAVEATVRVTDTDVQPEVHIGSGIMQAQSDLPADAGSGLREWKFVRELDGSEGEGPRPAGVAGTDEAGNAYTFTQSQGLAKLDFTPPAANCAMNPAVAKAGATVTLDVYTTEPLLGGLPELTSDLALKQPVPDPAAVHFTWSHVVPEGQSQTAWSFEVSLTDLAGIAAPGVCAGSGVIDGEAPAIAGGEGGIDVSDWWLPAGNTLEVSFDLVGGESLNGPPAVKAGPRKMALLGGGQGAPYVFQYTPDPDKEPPDVEGLHPISVTLADAAGNQAFYSPGSVTFDFTDPEIKGSEWKLVPPPACPLDSITALGPAAALEVTWTADAPLQSPPAVYFAGEGIPSTPVAATEEWTPYRTTFTHRFVEGQDAALPAGFEGTATIYVTASDLAGNLLDSAAIGQLDVDTDPPGAPDVESFGRIIYSRVPWGNAATGGPKRYALRGEAGSVDPETWVLAYEMAENSTQEIGRAHADDAGAFGGSLGSGKEFWLDPADRTAVHVQTMDAACNASDSGQNDGPFLVREVEWTATMGYKQPGSSIANPHLFTKGMWFVPSLSGPGRNEPGDPASLSLPDGQGITTSSGPRWCLWSDDTGTPGSRYLLAAAYDSREGRVVMFGGSPGSAYNGNDLWEWDGAWRQRVPLDPLENGVPCIRSSPRIAYDRDRSRIVLYGGNYNDALGAPAGWVWEWDGVSWMLIEPTDPEGDGNPAKAGSVGNRLVWDPVRGRTLHVAVYPNMDIWEWDGGSWELRQPEDGVKPPNRSNFAAAFDTARGCLVLFGGLISGNVGKTDEVWEWDGSSWHLAVPGDTGGDGNPVARYGASLAYDESRSVSVMFGGRVADKSPLSDTWEWNGEEWNAVTPADPEGDGNPAAGYDHVFSWHGRRETILLYGGSGGQTDTWEWDGTSWALAGPDPEGDGNPEPRKQHRMAADTTRSRVALFGASTPDINGDGKKTWEWNGASWRLVSDGSIPMGLREPGLVYDSLRQVSMLFGGQALWGDTVWEWDGTDWTEPPMADPENDGNPHSISSDLAMVFDSHRGVTVLYGGKYAFQGQNLIFGDVWEWDGNSWDKIPPNDPEGDGNPPPLHRHAMAFDPIRKVTVLYGGIAETGPPFKDTWEWNGLSWHKIAVQDPEGDGNPPDLHLHKMTWDGTRERVVLFQHIGPARKKDLWEFNGTSWRRCTPCDPDGSGEPGYRVEPAFAWDPNSGRLMLHGGQTEAENWADDLWLLDRGEGQRPVQTLAVSFAAAEAGDSASLLRADASWLVGGAGRDQDGEVEGALLMAYDRGAWVEVGANGGTPDDPAAIAWNTSDPRQLDRLLLGPQQWVTLAAVPAGGNGEEPARIAADYAEMTVTYRLDPTWGWGFDSSTGSEGWTAGGIGNPGEPQDGAWAFLLDQPDPFLLSPMFDLSPGWHGIRLKVRSGSQGATMHLDWNDDGTDEFEAGQSAALPLQADGEWNVYPISYAPDKTTRRLRIRPPAAPGGQEFAIDWIRFVK